MGVGGPANNAHGPDEMLNLAFCKKLTCCLSHIIQACHQHVPVPVKERTYIMIKPDGVQRGLVGEIMNRFERKGLKLVAMKLC